ncbi:MAG: response regulator [Chloroflexota bacterium]
MTGRLPLDLPRAIDQAVERCRPLLGAKSVTVVAEYPAHLPALDGDQAALESVVADLVAEAVQRTEHGEIKVRAAPVSGGDLPVEAVQAARSESALTEGGPWVMLSVTVPESAGGPPPPSRLQAAEAARHVVEAFGGHLWLDPHAGQVNLLLPFQVIRRAAPDMSPLRRSVESRLSLEARTPHTLLLVVDNTELGDLLSRDLTAAGYGVMLAGNGADGLAIARQTRPDLILLDLMVRTPSAFDIAMLLKQDRRTRNIPVLFLTLVGDMQSGVSVRAVNYLARPAGTGALVSAINVLLTSGVSPSARVLVVEPNDALRDTMVMMIQAHGYRVTEARGAEEALALAERVLLGLILVNAKLAQERDFWLLRNLRQVSADAGIYVLAEGLSEADGKAAVSRGASGYSDTGKLPDLLDRVRNGSD